MKRARSGLTKTFHKDDIDANRCTRCIFYFDLFGVSPMPTKDENYFKTSKRKHICGCVSSFFVGSAIPYMYLLKLKALKPERNRNIIR